MQSIANTALPLAAPVFRPKVGRPPSLPSTPLSAVILDAPIAKPEKMVESGRRTLIGISIMGGLAILAAYAFHTPTPDMNMSLHAQATEAAPRSEHIDVKSGDSGVVGNLTLMEHAQPAAGSYRAPSDGVPRVQAKVDKVDRERLLSILNRD